MKALKQKFVAGSVALVLGLAGVNAMAKGGMGDGERTAERMDYIFTELQLTEEQQTQTLAILETFAEAQRDEMKAFKEELKNREEKLSRDEMKALMQEKRSEAMVGLSDQLNTVLPADDTEALVRYLESHAGKGGKGGKLGT